ncbi:hypothetical protein C5167_004530 [Papaver somniferum]|uniref:Secreted protein n=1 Tax=Papaver somniferum TaxID=3469 RepID=A0A4Y7J9Q7_PAPSO|nr:hypothetical protein C5167_004530 [Papaver somniferum]
MKKMAKGFLLLHLIISSCLFITISADYSGGGGGSDGGNCTTFSSSTGSTNTSSDGTITSTNTTISGRNCTRTTSSRTTSNSGSIMVKQHKGTGVFPLVEPDNYKDVHLYPCLAGSKAYFRPN